MEDILLPDSLSPDSIEWKQRETVKLLTDGAPTLYRQIIESFNFLYDLVWNNRFGLTPPQAADALGKKGLSLFMRSGAITQFMNQQVPGSIKRGVPPEWTVLPQPDGSVKIIPAVQPLPPVQIPNRQIVPTPPDIIDPPKQLSAEVAASNTRDALEKHLQTGDTNGSR